MLVAFLLRLSLHEELEVFLKIFTGHHIVAHGRLDAIIGDHLIVVHGHGYVLSEVCSFGIKSLHSRIDFASLPCLLSVDDIFRSEHGSLVIRD